MKGTRKKILCQSTITWSLKKDRGLEKKDRKQETEKVEHIGKGRLKRIGSEKTKMKKCMFDLENRKKQKKEENDRSETGLHNISVLGMEMSHGSQGAYSCFSFIFPEFS